jgi:hypothetical protein
MRRVYVVRGCRRFAGEVAIRCAGPPDLRANIFVFPSTQPLRDWAIAYRPSGPQQQQQKLVPDTIARFDTIARLNKDWQHSRTRWRAAFLSTGKPEKP